MITKQTNTHNKYNKHNIYNKYYKYRFKKFIIDYTIFLFYAILFVLRIYLTLNFNSEALQPINIYNYLKFGTYNFCFLVTSYVLFITFFVKTTLIFYIGSVLIFSYTISDIIVYFIEQYIVKGTIIDQNKIIIFIMICILNGSIFYTTIKYIRANKNILSNNKDISDTFLRIPFPGILIYYTVISIVYIKDNLLNREVGEFTFIYCIMVDILSAVFMYSVVFALYVTILLDVRMYKILKFIPTLFILTLLRPVYVIISVFKLYDLENEDNELEVVMGFKKLFNKIFGSMGSFTENYSVHDIYFAIMYSLSRNCSFIVSLEESKDYNLTHLFVCKFKGIPFMRLMIPYIGIVWYAIYYIKDITMYYILVLWIFSYMLMDIILLPIYYSILKRNKRLQ